MNGMLKGAIAVLVASIVGMIWGFQYRSEHQLAAVTAFFGASDPLYTAAGWAAGLGVLAFVIGIALLIGGLVKVSRSQLTSGDQHRP